MPEPRARLRRALTLLALVAAAWSLLLAVTRGVSFQLGPLHISSRNARNPALAALLLTGLALWLAPAGLRLATLRLDLTAIRDWCSALLARVSPPVGRAVDTLTRRANLTAAVAVMAVAILALSWTRGAWVAGGADSFGYVSEAHIFANGRLYLPTPLLPSPAAAVPPQATAPLGYAVSRDGRALTPTYAPGLPLTMALVERVAGRRAVYIVMPLLGALAVWFTFLLGRRIGGATVGFGAALLLFAAPAFRFQLVGAPMSDVPAAAWWTMALVGVLSTGVTGAALGGLAAGAAILTRPNLLLLSIPLGCYLLWEAWRQRAWRGRAGARVLAYSAGVIAGSLTVAWFNAQWYGSPFLSGYSTDLFNRSFWWDNIRQYSWWLTTTHTPVMALGLLAPFTLRRHRSKTRLAETTLVVAFVLTEFLSYLFYMPFDAWWYLRFLLPAFPALAVATCLMVEGVVERLGAARRLIAAGVIGGAALFGLYRSSGFEALGEYRYQWIADWVRDRLPPRSAVLAMQHSGSLMLYANSAMIRYDLIDPALLDRALMELTQAGWHPYLVIDDWERDIFRKQFSVRNRRGALDWPPLAYLPPSNVAVWDLLEDPAAAQQRPVETIRPR